MDNKDRKKIEENDLRILHEWFEADSYDIAQMNELEYPEHPTAGRKDLWSEVLSVVVSRDKEKFRMLNEKVKRSNMSPEGKHWWVSVLSALLEAPLEELANLADGNERLPEEPNGETVRVAARKYANLAWYTQNRKNQKLREAERAKERELQQEAARREAELQQAENNLQRHRNSRS